MLSRSFLTRQFLNRVCDANMDGRDIVCVIPAGKSLPWRRVLISTIFITRRKENVDLPAASVPHSWLQAGRFLTHLVITDQILHL